MRVLLTAVLAGSLVITGQACAQQGGSYLNVEFRALDRERPGPEPAVLEFWSFYDHADRVEITVDLDESNAERGLGLLLTEVTVGVARIVWEDDSKEVPDYEATVARAYWLPAIATSRVSVDGEGSHVVAAVSPDELLAQLREADPELLTTALMARSCFLGATGSADGQVNCATAEIPLYMAH